MRGTEVDRQAIAENMTFAWQKQFSFEELKAKALDGHDKEYDTPDEREKADIDLKARLRLREYLKIAFLLQINTNE